MIYFVRHGQTLGNLTNTFYDERLPNGLTELGKNQAKEAAEKLKNIKFDICYVSPLYRTVETSKEVLKCHPYLEVKYDDRIVERKWGVEGIGKSVDILGNNRWQRYREFPFGGVETVDEMFDRIKSFYEEIYDDNKNILIISSSGVLRLSNAYFYGFPEDNDLSSSKYSAKNGDIVVFK